MSNNLLDVIKEVFNTYNYSLGTSLQGFDLLAEKPGYRVGIKLVDGASADDLKTFLDGLGVDSPKVLLITRAGFSDDVKKLGAQREIMMWDRAELERQIGKAVLASCETAAPPRHAGDIASLTSELYAPRAPSQPAAQPAAQPAKPAEKKPPAVEAAKEAPEGIAIPLHSVPIKVKAADAVKIAGAIGRAEDVELSIKFIPFWKYDYRLDVQSRYKDLTIPLNSKGSRVINAINRQVDPAPVQQPAEAVELPDAPYNVEETILTEEEARAMAIKAIVDENTKTVRFKGTQGEAAIVEHKKFQPRPQDVEMEMELLYIPFWAVRSHKGYMEINASDGKPTKMPIDDGAEIL